MSATLPEVRQKLLAGEPLTDEEQELAKAHVLYTPNREEESAEDVRNITEAAIAAAEHTGAHPVDLVGNDYVSRDELAAWITEEMGPKMATLAQRLDDLEALTRELRQHLDERIADSQEVASEWAETFNRAEQMRGEREEDVKAKLEILQQLDEQTTKKIGELNAALETVRQETDQKIAAALSSSGAAAVSPEGGT